MIFEYYLRFGNLEHPKHTPPANFRFQRELPFVGAVGALKIPEQYNNIKTKDERRINLELTPLVGPM